MIADLDIWRCAALMIKRYGEDAPLETAKRADELLDDGDMDGCAIWKLILAAIEDLQREKPKSDEGIH